MKTLTLLAALAVCPFLTDAAECPTPKLTCAQLEAKMKQRCGPDYKAVDCNCPDPPPCPHSLAVCPDCLPPTEVVKYVDVPPILLMPVPHGRPLLSFGTSYVDGPGLAVGGGYRLANGIDLIASLGYHHGHDPEMATLQTVGTPRCTRPVPVTVGGAHDSVGVAFDVVIPLGGK